jgi:PST family polysaccharide transporter
MSGKTGQVTVTSAHEDGADQSYAPPPSLTGRVVTSLKWSVSSRVIRDVTRLAMGIFLARLLTPSEWGIAGMALTVVALLAMLTDLGLPAALVQRVRITETDRSTLFWASVGIGAGVTLFAIAISGLVADLFGQPQVQSLFAVASLTFLIASLEKVPGTLLTREMAFRSLELRQIAATIAGAVAALVLALWGAGPWAIVGNAVVTAAVSCVFLWILTPWRPSFLFSWHSFRDMTGFGGKLLAAQLATYFQLNADKLLIGRYIGAAPLGNYQLGYQLMFTPIGNISYPLQGVMFPALSSMQEDRARMSAAWLRAKRLAVALMTPAFLIIFVVAPDFIPTVFGSKWEDAIVPLQLMCIAGIAHALGTLNWTVLMATDRTGTLFRLTLVVSAVVVVSVVVGLAWGIVGVAAGLAFAEWLMFVPQLWATTRASRVPFPPALRATCSPLPAAVVATAAAAAVRIGLVSAGVPALARIVVAAAALILAYLGVAYATSAPLREELRGAAALGHARLRRTRRRSAESVPAP